MKIVWSKHARQDLCDICDFLGNMNPEASVRLYNLIIKEANELVVAPYKGAIEETTRHTERALRSFVSSNRNYKIVYHVNENIEWIIVTHILDCRQDPRRFRPERFVFPYYSAEGN